MDITPPIQSNNQSSVVPENQPPVSAPSGEQPTDRSKKKIIYIAVVIVFVVVVLVVAAMIFLSTSNNPVPTVTPLVQNQETIAPQTLPQDDSTSQDTSLANPDGDTTAQINQQVNDVKINDPDTQFGDIDSQINSL